jgi:DNA repair exonuclease SbcCD ATPase subunit
MIILEINHFQTFKHHRIELPDHGVILLDGAVGIGKSTILEAISFALYNDVLESCYPETIEHPKTWVRLTMLSRGIDIMRSKNPNNIQVAINTAQGLMSYTGTEADMVICRYFGQQPGWLSSAYIRQEHRCDFLTMSGADKLELLQKLFMPDPELYSRRLEMVNIKAVETQTQIHQYQYQRSVIEQMYKQLAVNIPSNGEAIWTQEQYNEAKAKDPEKALPILYAKLSQLQSQLMSNQSQNKRREQISEQIKTLQMEFEQLNDPTNEITVQEQKRLNLERQLTLASSVEKKTKLLMEKTSLDTKISQLPSMEISKYTPVEIDRYEKILSGRSIQEIKGVIDEIQLAITYHKLIIKHNEQKQRHDMIRNFEALISDWTQTRSDIALIKLPDNPNVYIQTLDRQVQTLSQNLMIRAQRQEFEKSLSELPSLTESSYTKSQLDQWKMILNGPSVSELNVMIEDIDYALKYKDLYLKHETRNQITVKLTSISNKIKDHPTDFDQLALDDITRKLYQLDLEKTVLVCPECSAHVVLRDSKLHKKTVESSIDKITLLKDQSALNENKKKYLERQQAEPIINDLKTQLATIGEIEPLGQPNKYTTWYVNKLHELRANQVQLKLQRDSVPSINFDDEYQKIQVSVKRKDLLSKLEKIPVVTTTPEQLQEVQDELKTLRELFSRYQMLNSKLPHPNNEANTLQQLNNLRALNDTLDPIPEKPKMATYTLDDLHRRMAETQHELTQAENVPNGIDIKLEKQKIQVDTTRKRLLSEIESVMSDLDKLHDINSDEPVDVTLLKKQITDIILLVDNLRKVSDKRKAIQNKIHTLEDQLPDKVDCLELEQSVRSTTQEIENDQKLIKQIAYQTVLFQIAHYQNQYNQCCITEQQLTTRLGALSKLKSTLLTAEYVILDSILTNINSILEPIIQNMFEEHITVRIRSLKKLKTSDKVKPEINLEIAHKKRQVSKLNKLSGGQRALVNMAITMALSKLNAYPFLILDETMSCLHVGYRERMVKMFRSPEIGLRDKLTIMVLHDSNHGLYDHTYILDPKDLDLA